MDSLGGADGPSELSSKIRSLKTGVGSGIYSRSCTAAWLEGGPG